MICPLLPPPLYPLPLLSLFLDIANDAAAENDDEHSADDGNGDMDEDDLGEGREE